jgi:hypothetical protein
LEKVKISYSGIVVYDYIVHTEGPNWIRC